MIQRDIYHNLLFLPSQRKTVSMWENSLKSRDSQDKFEFPHINNPSKQPNYRQLFHWGCDQLAEKNQHCPINIQPKLVHIGGKYNWYNIYLAMKYGIWSSPLHSYFLQYFADCLNKGKKDRYYVFICHKYVYGIAKLVGFSPEKTFKYWLNQDDREGAYFGIINIKFMKIGRYQIQATLSNATIIGELFHHIWNNLDEGSLRINEMKQFDEMQYQRRTYYLDPSNLKVISGIHAEDYCKFNKMCEEFEKCRKANLGRRNFTNEFKKQLNENSKTIYKQKQEFKKGNKYKQILQPDVHFDIPGPSLIEPLEKQTN